MRTVRLAYRDRDRLPFIECVREMAQRHYGVEVAVQRIDTTEGYEDALFDDGCDVIIEHLEYLYARAAEGAEVTMFCAPVSGSGVQLVVPPAVASVSELSGATIAVRTSGRPESIFMRLRALHLDPEPNTVLVADAEVGRWGQWKKVVSGECAATFMSPIYLPQAEAAGLKVLPVPDIPMVGNFGQACLSAFASEDDGPMEDYMRAVVHAVCLMKFRPAEAAEVVLAAPTTRDGGNPAEVARRVDVIGRTLNTTLLPTAEAIANTHEIAVAENPAAASVDPTTLWDARWVERLERSGFIAGLAEQLSA